MPDCQRTVGGREIKLVDAAAPETHDRPYVVTLAPDRNVRWPVAIGNEPAPADGRQAHAFHAPGAVDADGRITDIGRRAIREGLRWKARASAASYCIVWGKDAGTFLLGDGGEVEGRRPPHAEPVCPEDYEAVNAQLVEAD